MSTAQRNDAWHLPVDPSVADILRLQSLMVLEPNHHQVLDWLVATFERRDTVPF
jgi:hypothetical protein